MPQLQIQFCNNNGLESYWDYTTSSAGRAGTGSVNNFTGNLVWVRSDIGFGGNRMPVSISHVYNANDALAVSDSNNSNDTAGNAFGLGNGWRTNYNQLVYKWSENSDYYVWEDSDGTDHYFIYDKDEDAIVDEDGLELVLTTGTVRLVYDYNMNVAYFDGIQLFKEQFGTSYTYDDEGNVKTVVDVQKQKTTYEYDTNNNLTKIIQDNKAKMTYEYYPNSDNVKTATSEEGLVYNFEYDQWGNNTKISIGNGTTKITCTAAYSTDGNRMVSTTDAQGNTTFYGYNEQTNTLDWVQYPEDSNGEDGENDTRTKYTYDSMRRMIEAEVLTDTDTLMTANYQYTNDLLTQIKTQTTTYNFSYGKFALREDVKIGDQLLASYNYTQDGNFYLSSIDYNNGDSVSYEYDHLGRTTKQIYEDGESLTYWYDNSGGLAMLDDSATGRRTKYYYDLTDRLMKCVESGTGYYHSIGYEYDKLNNLTALVETINDTEYVTSYDYDDDNRVVSVTTNGITVDYTYDIYGRIEKQVTKRGNSTILTETYTYYDFANNTTSSQIETYKTVADNYEVLYRYTYDKNGNILSVQEEIDNAGATASYLTSYAYDSANQLFRENNEKRGRTYTWTYDDAGNIQSYKIYAYTTDDTIDESTLITNNTYTYSDGAWGDQLIAYNGEPIDYDDIGNADGYDGWTFAWEHGTQMASQTKDGVTWNHTYDANGMRTKRSNGATTYEYIYCGDLLAQMIITDHTAEPDVSQIVDFSYDSSGMPLTMTYGGQTYYYVVNSQGNVMGLVDEDGDLKLSYTYEAFGAEYISTSSDAAGLAVINPLTYRGYVQDVETGMYYLQTRYYDPSLSRFFNRDTTGVLEMSAGAPNWDKNLYAYCDNNPVCREDTNGQGWHILIAAAVSGTIALVSSFIREAQDDKKFETNELLNVLVSTTCASGEGALSAMCGPMAMVWIGAGSAALESVANDLIDNAFCDPSTKKNWSEISTNAVLTATFSAGMGAFSDIKIGKTSDALEQGCDLLVDSIESTIKANSPDYHPKQKVQFNHQAKGSAKQLAPLFVKGSIGGQIKDIFTMWFEKVLID